ncbi:hypothetical protein UPYG_G00082140 [Umbra pygmaea]|uniref:Uncharacterized protein n=1 Tax=Umbra pygmaea TaxID=75934 RepID=A0ABD0XHA8_UMBPY
MPKLPVFGWTASRDTGKNPGQSFTKRQCTNEVPVDPSSSKETERESWSQVHHPPDPMQPALTYFLTPYKCGLFGVCSEDMEMERHVWTYTVTTAVD